MKELLKSGSFVVVLSVGWQIFAQVTEYFLFLLFFNNHMLVFSTPQADLKSVKQNKNKKQLKFALSWRDFSY